jgi:hypothetical protein
MISENKVPMMVYCRFRPAEAVTPTCATAKPGLKQSSVRHYKASAQSSWISWSAILPTHQRRS